MEETRSSHFERRDAARNMQRFYRLTVTRDLFGAVLLVREWGRIGAYARERREVKASLADARRDAARLAAQKQRRGYRAVEDGDRR
ncbi:WGR domain-containing protein [Shinella granuli]|uniref:Putative DNA-binding WGR domain protein n=1 Tax=Shinella granuli TaxID=323621 RepID=A0A4V2RIP7_SHIGR|nr:WGR domain-containing protein [Shinella granuli]TCN45030.1 putative DNA-binding WGR domain protein [Shinella granuli]